MTTVDVDPLPGDRQRTELPERVTRYWQVQSVLSWGVLLLIGIAVAALAGLPAGAQAALVLVPLAAGLLDALLVQPRRRRLWWYSVGEHQIDLQHGWLWYTRSIVPMSRVQHIAMQRGPLADRFTLAELHIHTAAGAVKIPALDRGEAIAIRQRIAELAQLADDL